MEEEEGGLCKEEKEDVVVEPIGLTDVEILFLSSNAI